MLSPFFDLRLAGLAVYLVHDQRKRLVAGNVRRRSEAVLREVQCNDELLHRVGKAEHRGDKAESRHNAAARNARSRNHGHAEHKNKRSEYRKGRVHAACDHDTHRAQYEADGVAVEVDGRAERNNEVRNVAIDVIAVRTVERYRYRRRRGLGTEGSKVRRRNILDALQVVLSAHAACEHKLGKNVKQLKRFEQEDKRLLSADSVGVFPRIMLAAPKSGSGKTLLTCGLLEVLRRRGLNPIACKCGPDYIDPMFHRYVLGIPGRNLDSFFMPAEGVRKVLVDAVREEQAGIAVLEGVMGYYDGLGGTETSASSWEIAEITDTPAILVLDCKGSSLSAAAMASGFLHFRKKSHIAGVILNRVSSMYYERLAAAVEEASGLPVLGYLPESEEYRMESRHLGLFLPGEIDRLRERIGRLADQMEKSIAVERVLEVAGMLPLRIENKEKEKAENESMEAESIAKFPACQEQKVTSRVRIGVARDEAFCFYYQENFRLLEQMGAELVYFSPLRDKKIPDRVDGLLFGGGYPENYARELAKNAAMRESIRRSIAAGMPFLAECGGFLYLHRTLEGSDGKHWEMAGVYPFDAYRTNRLRRFGYVRLLTSSGQEIHGHEFHYWESEDPGTDWEAVKPTGNRSWRCIHEKGGQIGGFPHLYYASCPDFLRKWLDVCAKGSQQKYIN